MKLDNIVGSIPDDRDVMYAPLSGPFPPRLDLKPEVFEIEDQLSVGSCTCNSSVSACEMLKPNAYSRLFAYWQTRNVIEDRPGAEGAQLRDAIRSHFHYGLPLESIWPYDVANVNVMPDPVTYSDALTRKVTRYERIDIDGFKAKHDLQGLLGAIKSALNEGLPVVVATRVGKEIQTLTGPWQTQKMHQVDDIISNTGNTWIGNHATLLIGYDDTAASYSRGIPGGFLDQNSWGKNYGDGGFFNYPYDAFYMDVFEAWVIRGFADVIVNPPAPPVPHLHSPQEVIGWFHSVWRYDVKDTDVDHPAVLYWADHPGGYHAFLDCEKRNHNELLDQLLAANP